MEKDIKVGDTIEWTFSDNHSWKEMRGKTFRAKVGIVDISKQAYGVYTEYGQDLIPFDKATKILT